MKCGISKCPLGLKCSTPLRPDNAGNQCSEALLRELAKYKRLVRDGYTMMQHSWIAYAERSEWLKRAERLVGK